MSLLESNIRLITSFLVCFGFVVYELAAFVNKKTSPKFKKNRRKLWKSLCITYASLVMFISVSVGYSLYAPYTIEYEGTVIEIIRSSTIGDALPHFSIDIEDGNGNIIMLFTSSSSSRKYVNKLDTIKEGDRIKAKCRITGNHIVDYTSDYMYDFEFLKE